MPALSMRYHSENMYKALDLALQRLRSLHLGGRQNGSATPTSTSHQVFDIMELLENILLYLPIRTMLLAKRVSRQFRDTIDGSLQIRRALFFEPLSRPTSAQLAIMADRSPGVDDLTDYGQQDWYEDLPKEIPNIAQVNPLLGCFMQYREVCYNSQLGPCTRSDFRLFPSWTNLRILRKSDASASWRWMLVVQPLAAPLYYCAGSDVFQMSLENWLSMQQLYDLHIKYTQNSLLANLLVQVGLGPKIQPIVAFGLHNGYVWTLTSFRMSSFQCEIAKQGMRNVCGWDVLATIHHTAPRTMDSRCPFHIACETCEG